MSIHYKTLEWYSNVYFNHIDKFIRYFFSISAIQRSSQQNRYFVEIFKIEKWWYIPNSLPFDYRQ